MDINGSRGIAVITRNSRGQDISTGMVCGYSHGAGLLNADGSAEAIRPTRTYRVAGNPSAYRTFTSAADVFTNDRS